MTWSQSLSQPATEPGLLTPQFLSSFPEHWKAEDWGPPGAQNLMGIYRKRRGNVLIISWKSYVAVERNLSFKATLGTGTGPTLCPRWLLTQEVMIKTCFANGQVSLKEKPIRTHHLWAHQNAAASLPTSPPPPRICPPPFILGCKKPSLPGSALAPCVTLGKMLHVTLPQCSLGKMGTMTVFLS